MTSLQLATTFDQPRPMSQQTFHHSPADSPRQGLVRPASQASHHLAPVSTAPANFSSAIHSGDNGPLTAFPGHFRPFTPSMTLPMPVPNLSTYNPYPPPTAPPLSYFPTSAPIYDNGSANGKNGQDMMRTYSHAHPMHSATDRTASTRYSPPFSAGGIHQHSPPSATTYNMSSIQPQSTIQISSDQNQGQGHINPSSSTTVTTRTRITPCPDRPLAHRRRMQGTIWVVSSPLTTLIRTNIEITYLRMIKCENSPIQ